MSDPKERQAVDPLGAPASDDVVKRLTAERLAPPLPRALGQTADAPARIAELESQLTEERAARKKAEAASNEMALLVAQVRTELAAEREELEHAQTTARQMAELVAEEHERSRRLAEDLRVARAQVPMIDQHELDPGKKPRAAKRMRRVLGR
jgi:chromosome segregation ATPase